MKDYEILEKMQDRNILDNDLYKFSMQYFIMCKYPNLIARFEFIDRNNTIYPKGFDKLLRKRIDSFRNIKLSKHYRNEFQKRAYFLPNLYFDFLEGFELDPSEVSIYQDTEGHLKINVEGYWYRTTLWEIILMSEISELYFLMLNGNIEKREILEQRNLNKANLLRMNAIQFVDFGTRRRYSFENQSNVIKDLKEGGGDKFIGTSNVLFGIDNNIKIMGTCAHEVICATAALKGYVQGNKYFMQDWSDVYNGNLGIILTDSFGLDNFLNCFDNKMGRLFDGCRHDSGDPFKFTDKIIEHYKKLNIDPLSKTIIFSDGLDVELTIKLADYCRGKIKSSFGIGTNFTNDVGVKPLNMVIKLVYIDNIPVIKLSDINLKHTGCKKTIEIVKELIYYKPL